jgi:ATP phosphoribosyltransferase regulatory subunit
VTRPSWILPDGLEECLPDEAWAIEDGRRACLDLFRHARFGLIMPPMLEYLDSLTSGVGQDLADQIMVVTDRLRAFDGDPSGYDTTGRADRCARIE